MIKSMTGFGRSEYSDGKRNIIVEVKSVNHRYCDISIRMFRRYSFAEEGLKNIVKQIAKRGKIDMSIIVENITEVDEKVKLNTVIAKQYYDNLTELKQKFQLPGEITIDFVATLPDVMSSVPDVEDEESILKSLSVPVTEAVEKLDKMRMAEGKKLAEDIVMRGELIRKQLEEIKGFSATVSNNYREKMQERIKELIGNEITIPEDRILLEAAIFADKCSITEEIVRLDSHINQLNHFITEVGQPNGKKLDFLAQEMNREINTIGSKANDVEITNQVLEIKSEIEKIREQVQNIE